ncbi:hypothetical protein SPRG_20521 [Saprolegnia parasitica CBS 223.65]|uniref:Uncharacterized protein n=1 Tax=Saprolegnia parasitica (strain CBS 223.65) TaxID=695850 RepID=A0A067C7L0_SAPPC|nr:hypothetical protein SPRG_20521 [Saprolegnia parasitica CBS 223.65]KDO26724.1 hypothetical protein SPRG_20521 [Saprolegnia parasitica CBS 223.65]|eukprot:XP_012202607.1 hypothetical protein SPRG_20521 [Saprolegnia parasitica CBS 223.65]
MNGKLMMEGIKIYGACSFSTSPRASQGLRTIRRPWLRSRLGCTTAGQTSADRASRSSQPRSSSLANPACWQSKGDRVAELVLGKHAMELVAGLVDAVAVVRVDDEDEAARVVVVVAPQRADLVLATDVPNRKVDVLVLERLDVEADGRDRRHDFAELELVEDCGFAGGVEADHEDADVLLAEEAVHDPGKEHTHDA